MRTRWLPLSAAFLAFLHVSCANKTTGSNPSGTGPFDSNGNYVEAWADSPSKWKKGGSSGSDAQPDQSELAAITAPLMGGGGSSRSSQPEMAEIVTTSRPTTSVASNTPKPRPTQPSAAVASNTPKPRPTVRATDDTPSRTTTKKSSATAANTTKSKGKATASNSSTSKSKATAKKTPAKTTKPSSSRYAVRQGDSLYAIAKRYGTTAGAIQKANGMSGTLIRPGQSLVIPK